jgi:Family of unknown function (DUF5763)
MNARCKAKKKSGERCRAIAIESGLCALHADPARAAELGRRSGRARRRVQRSGQAEPELRPPRTAEQVRDVLGQAMSEVRARRLEPKIASTMGYLASVMLKSIETSDIAERVAALESTLKNTSE